jgi:hypothetical protein
MEYAVFSDESRYDHGRFRSIAAVSLPAGAVVELSARLADALDAADLSELKWSNLGARAAVVRCAIAFVDHLLAEIPNGLRADVLIWDTEDARHQVPNRDDIANYERMYFHLHRALIRRRGRNTRWHLRPDEQEQIDWETLASCLTSRGTWRIDPRRPDASHRFAALMPAIRTFRQVDSEATPLSQLADLLAGMAAYTRRRRSAMLMQLGDPRRTGAPRETEDGEALSRRDKGRFRVITHLYRGCRSRRIDVSLHAHGYLCTADPKQPINFWHYQPQHPADKAPVAPSRQTGALA